MTEHEKLKQICDEIGYKYRIRYNGLPFFWNEENNSFGYNYKQGEKIIIENNVGIPIDYTEYDFIVIDVREIIFTPNFMEKFIGSYFNIISTKSSNVKEDTKKLQDFKNNLTDNLDNPVDYLYSLIFKK